MGCREFPTVAGGKFLKTYSDPEQYIFVHIQIWRFYCTSGNEKRLYIHICHVSFKDDLQVEEHNKTQVKYSLPLARSYRPTVLQFLEIYRNASVDRQGSSF